MTQNKYGGRRGWFKEPYRHSLARKGVKTRSKERLMTKPTRFTYSKDRFNKLSRTQQKGFIIDLAKKAAAGVKHAIQWEAQHLPGEAQWVKNEFNEAKNATKNAIQAISKGVKPVIDASKPWLKEHVERAGQTLEEFKNDLSQKTDNFIDSLEVKDERDHDEDGTPDISINQLEKANDKIKSQIQNQPKKSKFARLRKNIDDRIKQAGEKKREEAHELINEIASGPEKKAINDALTKTGEIDLELLNDSTLQELAIRTGPPILGENKYKREYFNRLRNRESLEEEKIRIARRNKERLQREKEAKPTNIFGF